MGSNLTTKSLLHQCAHKHNWVSSVVGLALNVLWCLLPRPLLFTSCSVLQFSCRFTQRAPSAMVTSGNEVYLQQPAVVRHMPWLLPSTLHPFSSFCSSLIYSDTWPFLKHHTISLSILHNSPQISHNFSLVLKAHYSLIFPFLSFTKFWLKILRALCSSCNISSTRSVRNLVFGRDSSSFFSFGLLFLHF